MPPRTIITTGNVRPSVSPSRLFASFGGSMMQGPVPVGAPLKARLDALPPPQRPSAGREHPPHRTRHTLDGKRLPRLVAQGLHRSGCGGRHLPRSARDGGHAPGAGRSDAAGDRNGDRPLAPRRPSDPGFALSQPRSRAGGIGHSEARKRLIFPTKRPTGALASPNASHSTRKFTG